jgi:hypothetical protein
MRLSVSEAWAGWFMRAEYGQHPDDPIECQRIYAALLLGESAMSPMFLTVPLAIRYIEATIDDLDVATHHLATNPPDWATKSDKQCFKRNWQRIQRRAKHLKKTGPYSGKIMSRRSDLLNYWGYEGKLLGGNDWPYYPVRSLCPGGEVKSEGMLVPYRFNVRPYKDHMVYRYVRSENGQVPEMPVGGVTLTIRPSHRERDLVR